MRRRRRRVRRRTWVGVGAVLLVAGLTVPASTAALSPVPLTSVEREATSHPTYVLSNLKYTASTSGPTKGDVTSVSFALEPGAKQAVAAVRTSAQPNRVFEKCTGSTDGRSWSCPVLSTPSPVSDSDTSKTTVWAAVPY